MVIPELTPNYPHSLCAKFDVKNKEETATNTRFMDGIILILFSWFFVSILCYFFILAYNRRRNSLALPTPGIWINGSDNLKFLSDLANWLLWGLDENTQNEQQLAPAFAKFVVKCLNETSRRLHKENQLEVHFDAIQLRDKSTISAFQDFRIHPNRTAGNHLSIIGQLSNVRNKHGPICLRISVVDSQEEMQFAQQINNNNNYNYNNNAGRRQQTPMLKGPSIRQYTIFVHELIGEIEARIAPIAGEIFIMGCFKDRPSVGLELQQSIGAEEKAFLEEFVRRCIFGAVINFSIGELLYPDAETSARASRARLSAEYRNLSFLQELYPPNGANAHLESPSRMSPKFPTDGAEMDLLSANCLRIQLIEAYELEGLHHHNGGRERPFVCIELDEPSSERFLSPRAHKDKEKSQRIYWNEGEANFELLVNPASGELLFEVFTEQDDENSYSTIRERLFLGMAILSLAELREIVRRQGGHDHGLVRLQLQGRPQIHTSSGRGQQQHSHGDQVRGILVMKCSFHHRYQQHIERPSAPQPTENQSPFAAAEYAQMKRRRTPNGNGNNINDFAYEEAPGKKYSTTTNTSLGDSISKKKLPRQKQHYIYNVTEDRLPYEYNYESETSGEKRSPSKISFDTSNLSPSRLEYEEDAQAYSNTMNSLNVNPVRKTISDTNALFHFEMEREERKRSAPERGQPQQHNYQGPKASEMLIEERRETMEEEIHVLHRPNAPYEHLFNGETTKDGKHPAMEIFKMPTTAEVGKGQDEIERKARERDRQAHGRKHRRNFFEQIRARLSGPVRLLPGKQTKRAKSLDDYEQPNLEEVASMPQSRDQSQTRYGDRKGSDHHIDAIPVGQHLFIKTTGPSSSAASSSVQLLPSPQTSQRTFSHHQHQLLLELVGPDEEGPRYYSIPLEISTEPAVVKLMQSGKKLHIHNGHILVASKSRGRIVCSICNKRIGGNFSNRQAYQCRDCRIVCHKNCHRQIDWICENSSLFNFHIEEVDWEEFLRHHQLREFISIGNL